MDKIVCVVGIQNKSAFRAAKDFTESGAKVFAVRTDETETAPITGAVEIYANPKSKQDTEKLVEIIKSQAKGLDILVLSSENHCSNDGSILQPRDYNAMLNILDSNVISMHLFLTGLLPLLEEGTLKRIAVLTEAWRNAGSCSMTDDFAYNMSKAAESMLQKIYYNSLRPRGFTFRSFCDTGEGMSAKDYIMLDFCDAFDSPSHSGANRLIARDGLMTQLDGQ